MASESRLYTFSAETKEKLRKFRLGTSRAKTPQAVIYSIDKATLAIQPSSDGEVYSRLQDVSDALPNNSPRFILLSHPLTLADGRLSVPYVLVAYMPAGTSSEQRMLYAGAKELMRKEAETGRVFDVEEAEEVEDLERRLQGED